MAKEEFESQDDRDDVGIFIHSELDDYGLNPLEFRVYGRLARRAGKKGRHTQSVPHMAEEFGVHKRSVQRALQLLVLCGLTTAQATPGRPTIYRLNPRKKWQDRGGLLTIREHVRNPKGAPLGAWVPESEGSDPASLGVRPQEPGGAPPQPYEGIPLKVLPEGTPKIPPTPQGGNGSGVGKSSQPRKGPTLESLATQTLVNELLADLEVEVGRLPPREHKREAGDIKWMLDEGYDPERMKACLRYYRHEEGWWKKHRATWATVAKFIGDWAARGEPEVAEQVSTSRNGHKEPQKYRDYISEDELFVYSVGPEGPGGTIMRSPKGPEGVALISGMSVEEVRKLWN